jgi:hypothetical protein
MNRAKSEELVQQLESFFGCLVGGSYGLVRAGVLDASEVSDVDVLIRKSKTRYTGVANFLRSQGYACHDPIDKYGNTRCGFTATKEGETEIHVSFSDDGASVWHSTPIDILCYKMRRGTERDWRHIELAAQSGLLVNSDGKKR